MIKFTEEQISDRCSAIKKAFPEINKMKSGERCEVQLCDNTMPYNTYKAYMSAINTSQNKRIFVNRYSPDKKHCVVYKLISYSFE